MYRTIRTTLAAGFLAVAGFPALSETIILQSAEGELSVQGELLAFQNGIYTIRTGLGELNISGAAVTCIGAACPFTEVFEGDFAVAGSDTVGVELMPLLIRGYGESLGALVEVEEIGDRLFSFEAIGDNGLGEALFTAQVEDKGSSTAFRALLAGEADIGMSSRRIRREEVIAFRENGLGDPLSFAQEYGVAIDGLLMVVHPDNPVAGLTTEQISQVLGGEITNWSELGGADAPINVYSRNTDSGTYGTIEDLFLSPFDRELSENATIMLGNQQLAEAVFKDPNSFSYVGFAYRNDTKPLGIVQSCGLVAQPTAFSAKTGEYPLQRTLYLYTTNKQLPQDAQDLISFASSPDATGVIEKSGFIGYNIDFAPQDVVAETIRAEMDRTESRIELVALRELFIDLLDWSRMSTTFRFQTGSSMLDNASQRELLRLASFMQNEGADLTFTFVGFTDSAGSFEANRALGLSRAEAVRNELAGIAPNIDASQIEIRSFGELNPVACNTDAVGQSLNRRVEVWVR